MKSKIISVLIFVALWILPACSSITTMAPGFGGTKENIEISEDILEKVSVVECAEPDGDKHQLVYAAKGICFLYPKEFDVHQADDGSLTLYVRSLLNTEAPLATISFEPAVERSVEEVMALYLPSDVDLTNVRPQRINLGNEMAVILEDLPGQDANLRVLAIREGTLYNLMVARIGDEYGTVGEQAEALYTMITESFRFIGVEPEAPLLAGPECPEPSSGSKLYTNSEGGFCLLLPEEYTSEDNFESSDGISMSTVYVDSSMNVNHPRLFITVANANGHSLEDITLAHEIEIETSIPGHDAIWNFGYMLDGIAANQFDQVPGQDLSRQVIAVYNNRVYTIQFIPDDPFSSDIYDEMQKLYDLVMDSFGFLSNQ